MEQNDRRSFGESDSRESFSRAILFAAAAERVGVAVQRK